MKKSIKCNPGTRRCEHVLGRLFVYRRSIEWVEIIETDQLLLLFTLCIYYALLFIFLTLLSAFRSMDTPW